MSAAPPHLALAHAKLNLTLRVLAREVSGYHQIETLFCRLELADEIEISLHGTDVRLDVAAPPDSSTPPPDLGPVHRNLAFRAALAFREHARMDGGVTIRLYKRIPAGAGLGGGSSDAAAVLTALNRLLHEPLPHAELLAIGAHLGSDVPFFLTGAPLALGWGRGHRLAPLVPPPSAPVVLAISHTPVATADAYEALARTRGDDFLSPPAIVDAHLRAWHDLTRTAQNDFEDTVFGRLPGLRAMRSAMAAHGAVLARMTGTGSTIFGLFDDVRAAHHAAARMREEFPGVAIIETRTIESI